MGIKLNIEGLNNIIHEVPDSSLIVVEGGIDTVSTIFVQYIAELCVKENKTISYVTSKTQKKVINECNGNYPIIEEHSHMHWKKYIKKDSILIIDSFSYLILEKSLTEVRLILEDFLNLCKQLNAIVILTIERDMLERQTEITVMHMSDGIIRFLSRDTTEGLSRFIRIPKWNDFSFDDNVYYTLDSRNKEINIDMRERVD